jgi:hypothetical protein
VVTSFAKYCCITEMAKKADKHKSINIRNKDGVSIGLLKAEALIDRARSRFLGAHNKGITTTQ